MPDPPVMTFADDEPISVIAEDSAEASTFSKFRISTASPDV